MAPEERTVAEDFTSPVEVQPGIDKATPADWSWHRLDTSPAQ